MNIIISLYVCFFYILAVVVVEQGLPLRALAELLDELLVAEVLHVGVSA